MGAISLLSTGLLLWSKGAKIPFYVSDSALQKSPAGSDREKESSYEDAFQCSDQSFYHNLFQPFDFCFRPFQEYDRRSRSYMSQLVLVFGPFEARIFCEGPMSFAG